MRALYGVFGALALAGCAAAPVAPVAVKPALAEPMSPFVSSAGMVIGTLSYNYVEVRDPSWVVHLQRIDSGSAEDYALPVAVDNSRHRGVFSGSLPEGVYAFREAAADGRHFPSGLVNMPFEVHSGEVRDAGHYAVNPVATE